MLLIFFERRWRFYDLGFRSVLLTIVALVHAQTRKRERKERNKGEEKKGREGRKEGVKKEN